MIDPQRQWAIQIDITNKCHRNCSNCTRMVGHVQKPFFMSLADFEAAAEALKNFPAQSPPPLVDVSNKVVGILGGEPLLHPEFAAIAKAMKRIIAEKKHRGLWTGLKWEKTTHAELIRDCFGLVHVNHHAKPSLHTPVLVACKDVIHDEQERLNAIDNCWLQQRWSGTITPKGYFFCEVAATMDMVLDGPGGLPVEADCWRRPLSDFQCQIDRWCHNCGIPLNLLGRPDREGIDDISESHLSLLQNSPQVKSGKYVLHESVVKQKKTDAPWEYR